MKEEKEYRLGIDIGGTNTELGMVSAEGYIPVRSSFPTTDYADINSYIQRVKDVFEELKKNLPENSTVIGAGVGVPCANQTTGCIEGATNLPWKGTIPLAFLLSEALEIPVSISNDANAAAAGERMFGAAKGIDNFIMITLGTGVGGAVVCDGHLLSGSRGFAAELGHITLGKGYDRECPCGRKGCLQTYTQASGVVRTALELLAADDKPSVLRDIEADNLSPLDIFKAAETGDAVAIDTFRRTGEVLGFAVANFLAFSDPDAVVLFGGVAKAGKYITDPMRKVMEKEALFLYQNRVRILTSTLPGSDAAILGAAALV